MIWITFIIITHLARIQYKYLIDLIKNILQQTHTQKCNNKNHWVA